MSAAMPAGGAAVPGERWVGGDSRQAGGWGAIPGLKARANPSRTSAAVGTRFGGRSPRPARGLSRRISPAASGQGARRTTMPTHDATVGGTVPGTRVGGERSLA